MVKLLRRQRSRPHPSVLVLHVYPVKFTHLFHNQDAAFHPSIFGESPDVISRLQERNYPNQKITIILPLLSDGVLVLGRTKAECILRVPGDGDLVSELKLRMDKGYYTLDSLDDPYVLASLLKLWLRKLRDPLVPDEMYNDCVSRSNYPEACVSMPVTDN